LSVVTVATLLTWWPITASAQIVLASHDPNVTGNPPVGYAEGPAGHHKVALAWLPPDSGSETSYILEAGTTPGSSDVFNGNIALTTSIAGIVGPGTYYVRVRAANAMGVGPPSNEVTIVVGEGPPGKPEVTSADASGNVVTVSWESGRGRPTPNAHRLDFFSAAGPLGSVPHGAETSITLPIIATGTFSVTITPFNDGVAGPPSEPFVFTLDSACNPLASPDVGGGVFNGTASVSWPPVPGATSYLLSAGNSPGGTEIVPEVDIGPTTTARAGVPAGFTAWVRVTAINACGQRSVPRDFLVQ
jgi:hypothetical protein